MNNPLNPHLLQKIVSLPVVRDVGQEDDALEGDHGDAVQEERTEQVLVDGDAGDAEDPGKESRNLSFFMRTKYGKKCMMECVLSHALTPLVLLQRFKKIIRNNSLL